MKRFALAIALTCVLSGSVLAGDSHTTGAPEPVPGDSHTGGAPEPAPTTQSSSVAVTVILTILSLVR